jgi:WhiB family transcriptional regulator, redox-sensing transcriptional regulator
MLVVAKWEEQRKCKDLTPEQADDILFPGKDGVRGSRGAPSKANRLCYGCPVKRECLIFAIENGLDGNWAATTKKERKEMATVMHLFIRPVEAVMPDEPKLVDDNGRRISRYRIVKKTVSDYIWMDSAVSPLD